MAFGYNIDQRKINKRNHIIDIFRTKKVLSKVQAKTFSGYSMDTVISIFNNLLDEGTITPAQGEQKNKGRKAHFYSLNPEKHCYLGVTFNQQGVYSSLVSFSGDVLDRSQAPLTLGISKDEFVRRFTGHIDEVLGRHAARRGSLSAVGCSVPGDIDIQTGILHSYTFMPFLNELNFKDIITTALPRQRITIDHNIHSMAAYILSRGDIIGGHEKVLFVSARSGTACGLIYNGAIVTGHGEFGHIRVSDDPARCVCGRPGCLDNYFSYRAFMELLSKHRGRNLLANPGELGEQGGMDELARLCRGSGDRLCDELRDRLRYFAIALLDTINVTAPDLVILTGDLLKLFHDDPATAVRETIDDHFKSAGFIRNYQNTTVLFQDLGTDIAATGVCLEMILEDWGYRREERQDD